MAKALSAETVEQIRKAYVPGVFGYKAVAKRFGISHTAVRRIVVPDCREHERKLSREAKRRRTGICVDCGTNTRYNGHPDRAVSDLCNPCASRRSGLRRRGHGPALERVLALLEGGPMRAVEIQNATGWTKAMCSVTLHRLLSYGLVQRPSRGVYALPEREAEVA